MPTLTKERLGRAGLVTVLLSGVAVATFGAGYRSSDTVLGNASTFLQRDHDVVRVNAESEAVDAQTVGDLAAGEQRLEVVELSAGVVYVVNNHTGEVWRLPTDTMEPEQVQQPEHRDPPEVVAGAGHAYLLNPADGTLSLLEGPAGTPHVSVPLPDRASISAVVVDGSGTAWALSKERGELYAIDGVTPVARHTVSEPGTAADLTLAGDRPIVYLPQAGVATSYDRTGETGSVSLPSVRGAEVAAPGAAEPVLVMVVRRTGELVTANLATGATDRIVLNGRAGNTFGPPVVAHGRVYLPDHTAGHVVVVQLSPLREPTFETVPGRREFEVFARNGRVWVNVPYYHVLLTFDEDGRMTRIDKGTGEEVVDDAREQSPGPSAPPPANQDGSPLPESPNPSSPAPDPTEPEDSPTPEPTEPEDSPTPQATPSPTATLAAVPNTVGMEPTQACDTLQAASLQCQPNPTEVHWQPNVVHSQSVPPSTPVVPGTAVEIVYSDDPSAAPLTRYRYRGPNELQPAWHLSTGGPPGANWTNAHQFGGAYGPYETAVTGLVPVYQAECASCGVPKMFFYAREARVPTNRPPGNIQRWSAPVPAFSCFGSQIAGTAPLMKLYSQEKQAWSFAVADSPEWQYRTSQDGGHYQPEGQPICWVWYQVPPFPGTPERDSP